jgi:hypothetical protein
MQYSAKEELSHFDGNALRNFRKLFNSGIIQKVLNYHKRSTQKPLKISIYNGNPTDTQGLLVSIAEQNWRKRITEKNQLPKGYTKSPKLGPKNYAFSKGLEPTEVTKYFSLDEDNVIVFPQGANEIAEYAQENLDKLQLPGLNDII